MAMSARGETRKCAVAVRVAGDQDQVIAGDRSGMQLTGPAAARLRAADRVVQLAAATGSAKLHLVARNRELEANDRPDRSEASLARLARIGLPGCLPEADRGIEAGVVGDRKSGQLEEGGAGDQVLDMAGAVEKAEVAMRVQLAVVVRGGHRTTEYRTRVL